MKKLTLLALAVIMTFSIAGCAHGGTRGVGPTKETTRLTIRLTGAKAPTTRGIESGAQEVDLTVEGSRSLIFVADASGTISQVVELDPTQAISPGSGQTLPNPVTLASTVYVVANVPDSQVNDIKASATLDDVKEFASSIITQTGYTSPAMANENGNEIVVSTGSGSDDTKTLSVTVEPLVARLEIVAMQAIPDDAGNTITAFKVTGVYVDNWYPRFDYTGSVPASDTPHSLEADLDAAADDAAKQSVYATFFAGHEGLYDISGPWAASGAPLMAKEPAAGEVWAYNVVAGNLPTIVVRIDNIEYTSSAGATGLTLSGPRYLSIVGYVDAANSGASEISKVARGRVYRLGLIEDGNSNFRFSFANLGTRPYEEAVSLVVQVVVKTWDINDYTPVLKP